MTDASSLFYGCYNLESVDLSGFSANSVTDMSYMFYGCESLGTLDVSRFNTSWVTDMSSMFSWCTGLTALDVSHFDTGRVADMSAMFYNCRNLTTLSLNGNTGSVTDMSYMFYDCESLTTLNMSNFDTRKVTNMGKMFAGCRSLKTLDVSRFDTGSVTNMGNMFGGCSSLTALDVSNFNTGKVLYMGEMFEGCSSLATLDLSSFDAGSAEDMWYMFLDCSSLTKIYSPKNVRCENAYILTTDGYAWYRSSGGAALTELPKNLSTTVQLTRKTKFTAKNTTVKLSKTSYIYDGKAKKPTVTVKDSKGRKISSDFYTVTYTDCTKVGTATLTIKFKNGYVGNIEKTYKINPKATTLKKVTPAKTKTVTVTWNKQATQTTGYEVQYATDKNFTKNKKTATVNKSTTVARTINGLSAKTTYYVRIRTYKKVNGTNYYSAWSKALSVKTK
jgi:surface protein